MTNCRDELSHRVLSIYRQTLLTFGIMAYSRLASEDPRVVGSDRVLAVLIELGRRPEGTTLDELASVLNSPKPTIHRALTSLRRASLAELTSRGVYGLGDEFFRLAFHNYAGRSETVRLAPLLKSLAENYGEAAHYAVLDGRDVVYRAKIDPPEGAIKLTSTIGGRNPAHCTAVGKLLLSFAVSTKAELRDWLGGETLPAKTPSSITDPKELFSELLETRRRGYATDDQENEIGINCVAVPAYLGPSDMPTGAISISGLQFRQPLSRLVDKIPDLRMRVQSIFPHKGHTGQHES